MSTGTAQPPDGGLGADLRGTLGPLATLGGSSAGGPVVRAVAALVGVPVAISLVVGTSIPVGVFLQGVVLGSLYGLLAVGLILVYRANRIVNFAQAALGAVPAVLALVLLTRKGLPYAAAVPIVLVGSVVLGAVIEVAFIRRFAKAPRLILTVATIGVAQLLAFIEFKIPSWVSGDIIAAPQFPTPFSGVAFRLGASQFRYDHVVAVVVVAVLVTVLGAFLRYSDVGVAARAAAENAERAALLGIPVRRVSTIVWMFAALLSGVGVFLRAPLVGIPVGGTIGPAVLLFGLAAAVVGRMERMPTAFVAGVTIGMIDQSAIYTTQSSTAAYTVILGVIVVALLAQRGALSRAQDSGVSTWQATAELRKIPPELRSLPEVVGARLAVAGLVAAIAVAMPFAVGPESVGKATLVLIYAVVGVSLVILTGWAGQISLGQFAIAGVGAAVAGGLAANANTDFFLNLAAAGVVGACVAVVIGLPALRIQGLFLAVTTLAVTFPVQGVVLDPRYFGWLLPDSSQVLSRPTLYGRFDVSSPLRFYFVCLVALGLTLALAGSLRKYRTGRVLVAARDNGRLAQAFGVNLARTRLAAFAISGFVAAVGGGLFAYQQQAVNALSFRPDLSLSVLAMVVIGGATSLSGAVLGSAWVFGIPLLLEERVEGIGFLASGVGLLLLLLVLPGGLVEGLHRVRDVFLRSVAAKHAIVVPSLVADSRTPEEPPPRPSVGEPTGVTPPELVPAGVTPAAAPAVVAGAVP